MDTSSGYYEQKIEKLVASENIDGLIELSEHRNSRVALLAIKALGHINKEDTFERLISILKDLKDSNKENRLESAQVLDQFGWKPKNCSEEFYYLAAFDRWGEIASPKYLDVLIDEGLKNDDQTIRYRIVRILGRIDDNKAIYGLHKITTHENTRSDQDYRILSTADGLIKKSGKTKYELYKIISENKQDEMYIKIEEMKNQNVFFYLEKFVFKFRGYHGNSEIKKLENLLNYRGFDIDNIDLKNILDFLISELSYNEFKKMMDVNSLANLEEYAKVLFEVYDERYENYLGFFERLLYENNIIWNQKIFERTISELKKEKELLLFEKFLVSDTSESPFITINDVDLLDGYKFEKLLKILLEKKGYYVENTPLSGDQGADLIISGHGEKIAVQAKCYNGKVSNKAVQEVTASIAYYRANRGIITNSDFTSSAYDLADSNNIELINRKQLEKMIKYYLISKEEIQN